MSASVTRITRMKKIGARSVSLLTGLCSLACTLAWPVCHFDFLRLTCPGECMFRLTVSPACTKLCKLVKMNIRFWKPWISSVSSTLCCSAHGAQRQEHEALANVHVGLPPTKNLSAGTTQVMVQGNYRSACAVVYMRLLCFWNAGADMFVRMECIFVFFVFSFSYIYIYTYSMCNFSLYS